MADETKTWQEKADAFKTLLQPNGIYAQIVYQSDSHHDCEPIPIPYKLDGRPVPVRSRSTNWHEPSEI
jgi:hypothetical protein